MAEQAEHMHQLIDVLFDVARLETGQMELQRHPLDLVTLIQRVTQEVEVTLDHHQLKLESLDTPLMVMGNEQRLQQVLHNLLGNAIKYSPQGGIVTVRVAAYAGKAWVSVTDQGIGIPANDVPNLFRRFYRARNTQEQHISGIGVGLYVIKEIIQLHGGSIQVESSEGEGSTFTISLPVSTDSH